MPKPNIFDVLAKIFEGHKVSCILVGGFALNAYQVARQTVDIDFLTVEEDYRKVLHDILKQGYREGPKSDIFARLEGVRDQIFDIDFLFVDHSTLEKIRASGKEIQISGNDFWVPSVGHLIAMKLHAMKQNPAARGAKDLADIVELIKVSRLNIHSDSFRDLCIKYGGKNWHARIREELERGE